MSWIPVAPKPGSLDLAKHRTLLGDWLATVPGLVAELARDELADITRLTEQIDALAKRIGERVRVIAPVLLAMPGGCGELTAAKIVGETAGGDSLQKRGGFRPPQRCSADSRLVGQHRRTGPHDPHRQSPTQRRPAPHRRHPNPASRPRTDLLPTPTRPRRFQHRGPTLPQTPTSPRLYSHLRTDHQKNHLTPCQTAAA